MPVNLASQPDWSHDSTDCSDDEAALQQFDATLTSEQVLMGLDGLEWLNSVGGTAKDDGLTGLERLVSADVSYRIRSLLTRLNLRLARGFFHNGFEVSV